VRVKGFIPRNEPWGMLLGGASSGGGNPSSLFFCVEKSGRYVGISYSIKIRSPIFFDKQLVR